MCFSATTSFIAGTTLAGIGVATVRYVKVPTRIPFAVIPFIFSVQQFCEGFIWLSFTKPAFESWQAPTAHIFLVFAQVVWPVWIPLSVLLLERVTRRKRWLSLTLCVGVIVAICMAHGIIAYPVSVSAASGHIYYAVDSPYRENYFSGVLYFIPTVLPSFISRIRKMQAITLILVLSFIISRFFFHDYVISVWCFFATLISVVVLLIIRDLYHRKSPLFNNRKTEQSLSQG